MHICPNCGYNLAVAGPLQQKILVELLKAEQRGEYMNALKISRLVASDKSTSHTSIKSLEEKGLVKRAPMVNRCMRLLTLTDAGRKMAESQMSLMVNRAE